MSYFNDNSYYCLIITSCTYHKWIWHTFVMNTSVSIIKNIFFVSKIFFATYYGFCYLRSKFILNWQNIKLTWTLSWFLSHQVYRCAFRILVWLFPNEVVSTSKLNLFIRIDFVFTVRDKYIFLEKPLCRVILLTLNKLLRVLRLQLRHR